MPTKVSIPVAGPTTSSERDVLRNSLIGVRFSGAAQLGVLALAFCALPMLVWMVSGHWVPEVMVFGLAAGLVGLVSKLD